MDSTGGASWLQWPWQCSDMGFSFNAAIENPGVATVSSMHIKDLARRTGVDTETIRYYEQQGLLPAPARRDNGYRDYGDAHLERLAFIRHCRALDMPLADVRQLLGFLDQPEG